MWAWFVRRSISSVTVAKTIIPTTGYLWVRNKKVIIETTTVAVVCFEALLRNLPIHYRPECAMAYNTRAFRCITPNCKEGLLWGTRWASKTPIRVCRSNATYKVPKKTQDDPKRMPFFEGCRGAVDGSHISIVPLGEDQAPWRNRKGFMSQNVLAACVNIGLIDRDTFMITAPSRDRATMGFPYAPNPLVMSELITATFCRKPSAPLVVRFDSGYTGIPGNSFKATFCRFTL